MTMVWQSLKNETDIVSLNFAGEDENLSPGADVLHKTSNLVCSADDGKEMDKNEKRMCSR